MTAVAVRSVFTFILFTYSPSKMNTRAHKAFMLNFFLDEGLGSQLAEAVRLVTAESTLSVLHTVNEVDEDRQELPRFQDDQFKEQFRMKRSSFEVSFFITYCIYYVLQILCFTDITAGCR